MTARLVSIATYLALLVVLDGVEATARRTDAKVPTFADELRGAMRTRAGQFAVVLAWWWLGWHFLLGL